MDQSSIKTINQCSDRYNILAIIEMDQNFQCYIRVLIITQNKKGRHNMLWSAFWTNFTNILKYLKLRQTLDIKM